MHFTILTPNRDYSIYKLTKTETSLSAIPRLCPFLHMVQVDLKGIPTFVMNLVLKRHPLAVHYVRQQLINPKDLVSQQSRLRLPSSSSSTLSADDQDIDDTHIFMSMELPEDFVPSGYDSEDSNDMCSSSFEQSMPIEHFTKLY